MYFCVQEKAMACFLSGEVGVCGCVSVCDYFVLLSCIQHLIHGKFIQKLRGVNAFRHSSRFYLRMGTHPTHKHAFFWRAWPKLQLGSCFWGESQTDSFLKKQKKSLNKPSNRKALDFLNTVDFIYLSVQPSWVHWSCGESSTCHSLWACWYM